MKTPLTVALAGTLFTFVSCSNKVQDDPYAGNPAANPANPYGVPQAPEAPVVSPTAPGYAPPQVNAPGYEPVPAPPVAPPAYGDAPRSSVPVVPSGGSQHVVVAGDTLWGLSRRYNTSVDAIKAANGLSSNTIVKGTTLTIPK